MISACASEQPPLLYCTTCVHYVPSLVMKEMNSLTHSCMHSLASLAIFAFSGSAVFMIRATGAKLCMLASLSQMVLGLFLERAEGWEVEDCGEEEGIAIRPGGRARVRGCRSQAGGGASDSTGVQTRRAVQRYMWPDERRWPRHPAVPRCQRAARRHWQPRTGCGTDREGQGRGGWGERFGKCERRKARVRRHRAHRRHSPLAMGNQRSCSFTSKS